jgi:hypothetical protein
MKKVFCHTSRMEIKLIIEGNETENEVTVGLRYYPAERATRFEPGCEAEFVVLSAKDESGNDFDLTESQEEKAIEIAFEKAEMDARY